MNYKNITIGFVAFTTGAISSYLGEYTITMSVLFTLMISDYFLGTLGALLGKSKKTELGGLSSQAGFHGLMKKIVILVLVAVGFQLDRTLNTNMIREMVIVGYSANELVSIVEHAGVLGVPIPPVIEKAIEILNTKAGEDIETRA